MLDLGAGTGRLTRELVQRFASVVAIEPDDEMRALVGTGAVLAGTAESIPLEDASVECVFVGEAFHWFDAGRAIDEIARVLVPRGGLAIIWSHWWETELRSAPRSEPRSSTACVRFLRALTGCR